MDIDRSHHVIIYCNAKGIPSDTDSGQTINVLHQFSELWFPGVAAAPRAPLGVVHEATFQAVES